MLHFIRTDCMELPIDCCTGLLPKRTMLSLCTQLSAVFFTHFCCFVIFYHLQLTYIDISTHLGQKLSISKLMCRFLQEYTVACAFWQIVIFTSLLPVKKFIPLLYSPALDHELVDISRTAWWRGNSVPTVYHFNHLKQNIPSCSYILLNQKPVDICSLP